MIYQKREDIWKQSYGILAFHLMGYNAKLLYKLEGFQIIVRLSVSCDNVDLTGARRRNIAVYNVSNMVLKRLLTIH